MKTRFGSNSSTDIVVMGETKNFLEFITTTLYSLPPVPSPESLLCSPDVSCSDPLKVRPSVLPRGVSRVSRRIIPWIIVLTFTTFFNFMPYILTITLFEVPFIFYYSRFLTPTIWMTRNGFKLFAWILQTVIAFLSFYSLFWGRSPKKFREIPKSPSEAEIWRRIWRSVYSREEVYTRYARYVTSSSWFALSTISYILAGGRSFRSLTNVRRSLDNPE